MNESTVLIDSPQETLPYKISPVLSGSLQGMGGRLPNKGLQSTAYSVRYAPASRRA
jgi:hypothetical protein